MNQTAQPLAVTYDNVTVAWQIGDEVYLAPFDSPIDSTGAPTAARWESTLAHWQRYWTSVHSDRFLPFN